MGDDGHVSTIRVLVADNSRFHTQLLARLLTHNPGLHVICSDLDAVSVVAASIKQKIDVCVFSAFRDEDARRGFDVLEKLRETQPNIRVVLLLDSSKPDSVLDAFRAGARGVFDHEESSDVLCECIRKVHSGQVWINDQQLNLVLNALVSAPKARAIAENGTNLLSKREADVVRCLAEGLTNREIAERLGLSQHTIKNYLFHIFDKLGVSNRVELLFMTLSHGTAAPLPVQTLLENPDADYDGPTLALLEKAAEQGVLAAQLMLARYSWAGQRNDSELIRAHVCFSLALDQISQTRNAVKKAMTPTQLAEAERRVRELLHYSRIPSLSSHASSEKAAIA